MIYNVILRLIERGQTEGLEEKADVFFLTGKLTLEEYELIMEMLGNKE